jgi:hypothetical protein
MSAAGGPHPLLQFQAPHAVWAVKAPRSPVPRGLKLARWQSLCAPRSGVSQRQAGRWGRFLERSRNAEGDGGRRTTATTPVSWPSATSIGSGRGVGVDATTRWSGSTASGRSTATAVDSLCTSKPTCVTLFMAGPPVCGPARGPSASNPRLILRAGWPTHTDYSRAHGPGPSPTRCPRSPRYAHSRRRASGTRRLAGRMPEVMASFVRDVVSSRKWAVRLQGVSCTGNLHRLSSIIDACGS